MPRIKRKQRVRMRNGVEGTVLWLYVNPVRRSTTKDRAAIGTDDGRTWNAPAETLTVVKQ